MNEKINTTTKKLHRKRVRNHVNTQTKFLKFHCKKERNDDNNNNNNTISQEEEKTKENKIKTCINV